MVGIYKISNTSGIYIGATFDFRRRQREHKSREHGHKGSMSFIIELPIDVTKEVLNNYEEFCYNQFKEAGFTILNKTKPGNVQYHAAETISKIKFSKTGKFYTEKHKENISKSKFKPVLAFNMNGDFIKEFESLKSAAFELNLHSSNITKCLQGKQFNTKGFIFKYK